MNGRKAIKVGVLVEITREFGRAVCRGISELAREQGSFNPYLLSMADLNDTRRLKSFDGFIARVMNDHIARTLTKTGRPVVDVYYDKPHDGFAIVKTRHSRIGTIAAEHFLSRRFTNFAFCGFSGGRFSAYCQASFTRALARQAMTCHRYEPDRKVRYNFNKQVLINEQLQLAPDAKAMSRWLAKLPKPIAVFCPNDLRAWQLLQVCRQDGIAVPQQVAILGLDNDILVCGLANPMISSIDPDSEAIGRCAAATLMTLIENPALANRQLVRQVNPIGVVTRTSTEVYPIEPAWLSDALVYINRNIARNLTASDVYREVGLSHTIVDRMFKAKLAKSVQDEIADIRLERVRAHLEKTRLSIQEIAPLCGFSSPQYLIRTFKARYHVSPSHWRAQFLMACRFRRT